MNTKEQEPLKFHMKLRLYRTERDFGPGVTALMQLVKEKGSLSAATKEMGMAYSKAWKIIKKAEEDLGIKLMEGSAGGIKGGGTTLTKEGEEMLENYQRFVRESQTEVEKVFQKYFNKSQQ